MESRISFVVSNTFGWHLPAKYEITKPNKLLIVTMNLNGIQKLITDKNIFFQDNFLGEVFKIIDGFSSIQLCFMYFFFLLLFFYCTVQLVHISEYIFLPATQCNEKRTSMTLKSSKENDLGKETFLLRYWPFDTIHILRTIKIRVTSFKLIIP